MATTTVDILSAIATHSAQSKPITMSKANTIRGYTIHIIEMVGRDKGTSLVEIWFL